MFVATRPGEQAALACRGLPRGRRGDDREASSAPGLEVIGRGCRRGFVGLLACSFDALLLLIVHRTPPPTSVPTVCQRHVQPEHPGTSVSSGPPRRKGLLDGAPQGDGGLGYWVARKRSQRRSLSSAWAATI